MVWRIGGMGVLLGASLGVLLDAVLSGTTLGWLTARRFLRWYH